MKLRKALSRGGIHVILVLVTFASLFPILWMVSASLKPELGVFDTGLNFLPKEISLDAYSRVLRGTPIAAWLKNSMVLNVVKTALETAIATLAAFAFARFSFRGKRALFHFILITMLLPPQIMMLPTYLVVDRLGWVDAFAGVVIPFAASGFGILMLRQAFLKVPKELVEASEIDGCGPLRSLLSVYLPISGSAVLALIVILFAVNWNEYYWSWMILVDKAKFTMPVGAAYFQNGLNFEAAPIMAVATLTTLPVLLLYIVAQRRFMEGFIGSGIQG